MSVGVGWDEKGYNCWFGTRMITWDELVYR